MSSSSDEGHSRSRSRYEKDGDADVKDRSKKKHHRRHRHHRHHHSKSKRSEGEYSSSDSGSSSSSPSSSESRSDDSDRKKARRNNSSSSGRRDYYDDRDRDRDRRRGDEDDYYHHRRAPSSSRSRYEEDEYRRMKESSKSRSYDDRREPSNSRSRGGEYAREPSRSRPREEEGRTSSAAREPSASRSQPPASSSSTTNNNNSTNNNNTNNSHYNHHHGISASVPRDEHHYHAAAQLDRNKSASVPRSHTDDSRRNLPPAAPKLPPKAPVVSLDSSDDEDDLKKKHAEEDEEDDVDEEEKLRAKREAILAKFRKKTESASGTPTASITTSAATSKESVEPSKVKEDDGDMDIYDKFEVPDLGMKLAAAEDKKQTTDKEENNNNNNNNNNEVTIIEESKPLAVIPQAKYDIFSDDPQDDEQHLHMHHGRVTDIHIENPDNWVDAEGYFIAHSGEILADRYKIVSTIGKGVFSTVIRCKDISEPDTDPQLFAIKVIRRDPSNTMYNAGKKEIDLLKVLGEKDPENKRFCIRLISHFEHKNHLCMVFPALEMNLRELVKKYGRGVGISLKAVKSYARQMFTALKLLSSCEIVHGDIKLDNILVTNDLNRVFICDFGSADWVVNCEITPYMQSRWYRAPEIPIGLKYDTAMDMWSIGCCLFELYTGKYMFPGKSNNEMIKLWMDYKGPFSKKMLRQGQFTSQHFEDNLQTFNYETIDPVTKQNVIQKLNYFKPNKSIASYLHEARGVGNEDRRAVEHLSDLLEKIFALDPKQRLKPKQALEHPFCL